MTGENEGAAPAVQTPAQGANAPQPSHAAPPEDYTRLQELTKRQAESINGYKAELSGYGKYGFKKPDELAPFDPLLKFSRERNISPAAMHALIAEHFGGAGRAEPEQANTFDPNKINELVEKGVSERFRKRMERDHEAAEREELDLIESLASELDKDDEWERGRTRAQLILEAIQRRQEYGEDHELKGMRKPLGRSDAETLRKIILEGRSKAEGERLARLGKAAASPAKPASTVAGKSGEQAPKGSEQAPKTRREFVESLNSEATAASIEAFIARQGGSTAAR